MLPCLRRRLWVPRRKRQGLLLWLCLFLHVVRREGSSLTRREVGAHPPVRPLVEHQQPVALLEGQVPFLRAFDGVFRDHLGRGYDRYRLFAHERCLRSSLLWLCGVLITWRQGGNRG